MSLLLHITSQMDSLLALKADLSGANFTGAITAPSIIQDMNGFSISVDIITPYTQVGYCSIVQNGNKLTIVLCGTVNLASDQSFGEYSEIIRYKILMPSAVGSKIIPLVSNRIDQKYVKIFSNTFRDFFDLNVNMYKDSDTQFKVGIYGSSGTPSMVKERDYAFRVEETFLLSDNLAE